MKFLTSNLLAIALAFGGGAMAVGSFTGQYAVQRELAQLRQDLAVAQNDISHIKGMLDRELRAAPPDLHPVFTAADRQQ